MLTGQGMRDWLRLRLCRLNLGDFWISLLVPTLGWDSDFEKNRSQQKKRMYNSQ
jgi:hypothetical protein